MLTMNRSVVSFQSPMKTLTIDGRVVLTALGSYPWSFVCMGDRPSAMAASFWPLSTACRPPLRTSAM